MKYFKKLVFVKILLITSVLFFAAHSASADVPITSCVRITQPGTYFITRDIVGTTLQLSVPDQRGCIRIESSDVVLDGQGHRVSLDIAQDSVATAIQVVGCRQNVTIRDLNVGPTRVGTSGTGDGIRYDSCPDSQHMNYVFEDLTIDQTYRALAGQIDIYNPERPTYRNDGITLRNVHVDNALHSTGVRGLFVSAKNALIDGLTIGNSAGAVFVLDDSIVRNVDITSDYEDSYNNGSGGGTPSILFSQSSNLNIRNVNVTGTNGNPSGLMNPYVTISGGTNVQLDDFSSDATQVNPPAGPVLRGGELDSCHLLLQGRSPEAGQQSSVSSTLRNVTVENVDISNALSGMCLAVYSRMPGPLAQNDAVENVSVIDLNVSNSSVGQLIRLGTIEGRDHTYNLPFNSAIDNIRFDKVSLTNNRDSNILFKIDGPTRMYVPPINGPYNPPSPWPLPADAVAYHFDELLFSNYNIRSDHSVGTLDVEYIPGIYDFGPLGNASPNTYPWQTPRFFGSVKLNGVFEDERSSESIRLDKIWSNPNYITQTGYSSVWYNSRNCTQVSRPECRFNNRMGFPQGITVQEPIGLLSPYVITDIGSFGVSSSAFGKISFTNVTGDGDSFVNDFSLTQNRAYIGESFNYPAIVTLSEFVNPLLSADVLRNGQPCPECTVISFDPMEVVFSVPGSGEYSIAIPDGAGICRADFDTNGNVNESDIFAFLTAWFAGDMSADIHENGQIQVNDIFVFLSLWFAGC